ncbi:MAG: hypothetical protein AAFQ94_07825 [Bacteroidota bacterium]
MKKILITLTIVAMAIAAFGNNPSVSFKVKNKSQDTVEIVIPGYSKATLMPKTVSKLELSKGQKIFFNYHNRQYTLLTVSNQMKGEVLDICQIIESRKQQIDATYISR